MQTVRSHHHSPQSLLAGRPLVKHLILTAMLPLIAGLVVVFAMPVPAHAQLCPADFDRDGVVTLTDFTIFADCLAGPGRSSEPLPPASLWSCLDSFDLDSDNDIDLADFQTMARIHALPCSACGNSTVEYGEQCDPPSPGSCTESCQFPAPHSDCDSPLPVYEGHTPFNNFVAESGPLPGTCATMAYDLWFTHTATCTGYLTVSLCGSSFDTVVEVFDTNGCPSTSPISCNDDGCGTGLQSRLTFPVQSGHTYSLRLGSWDSPGQGLLSISCANSTGFAACTAEAGDCQNTNGSPGCEDATCCATVCAADSFCCDVDWDNACVATALSLCDLGQLLSSALSMKTKTAEIGDLPAWSEQRELNREDAETHALEHHHPNSSTKQRNPTAKNHHANTKPE